MVIIVMDKGHGQNEKLHDPGACGNGLIEANLTDKLVDKYIEKLSKYENIKIEVCPRYELVDRTNFANKINPSLLLSCHINAGGGTGFESFVYTSPSQKSIEYQNIIHNEISKYLKQFNIVDRGKKRKNLHMVRESNCPAILVENLFIDNVNDAKYLKDEKFLDGLAEVTVQGIVKCFGLKLKPQQKENKLDYIGHEFEESIKYVKDLGILTGYPDGNFKPDENVTRGQMAVIIQRLYELLKK